MRGPPRAVNWAPQELLLLSLWSVNLVPEYVDPSMTPECLRHAQYSAELLSLLVVKRYYLSQSSEYRCVWLSLLIERLASPDQYRQSQNLTVHTDCAHVEKHEASVTLPYHGFDWISSCIAAEEGVKLVNMH